MILNSIITPDQQAEKPIARSTVLLERNSNYILHVLSDIEEIDTGLLGNITNIPYPYWGGNLNIAKMNLVIGIPQANFSTLIAICQIFLNLPESYWNDNTLKTRDFKDIMELIEKRLQELGYQVTETESQHYLDDNNKKRLYIPTKIIPIT